MPPGQKKPSPGEGQRWRYGLLDCFENPEICEQVFRIEKCPPTNEYQQPASDVAAP